MHDAPRSNLPRWARIPVLGLLAVFAVYLAGGIWFSLIGLELLPRSPHASVFWLGHWRMFTERRPEHRDLILEVSRGDDWEIVPLGELFPDHGVAGPGYLRRGYWGKTERLEQLAQASCARVAPATDRVRLVLWKWPKTLGSAEQPRTLASHQPLLTWTCT